MSRSKKYKAKMSREKQRKKPPYMSILFIVVVIAIFGSAAYLVTSKTASLEPQDKDAIKMTITMSGFEPNVIRAKVGQPVKINLINPDSSAHTDGGGFHEFVLSAGSANVNVTLPPLSQKVITFTPTQAGEYQWYCDSCCGGKENPSMQGTLIVT